MKAIVLAGFLVGFYLVSVTIGFRFCRADCLRARFMTRLFLITVPLGVVLYGITPNDLWFLPRGWLEANHLVEVFFFSFVYAAVFFGGILQLYNLADRGFSLRMMIDIDQSAGDLMTADQVLKSYGAGRGLAGMYQKRMDDLVRLKLVTIAGDTVRTTQEGKRVALQFAWMRRFLRVVD